MREFKKGSKTSSAKMPNHNKVQAAGSTFFGVQPKLKKGQKGDAYEVEADRAADQVTAAMDSPGVQAKGMEEEAVQSKPIADGLSKLQMKEEVQEEPAVQSKEDSEAEEVAQMQEMEEPEIQAKEEEPEVQAKEEEPEIQAKEEEPEVQAKEEEPEVQAKEEEPEVQAREEEETAVQEKSENEATSLQDSSLLEQSILEARGLGSPLPIEVQLQLEQGFGADFSEVRIHTDPAAIQMCSELNAQAFTHGNDIFFNEGKYQPQSREGRHLLAHELTHTLQQQASDSESKNKKGAISKINSKAIQPNISLQNLLNQQKEHPPIAGKLLLHSSCSLEDFLIIPSKEAGPLFIPRSRLVRDIGGFWCRQRKDAWFKIPNGCMVKVSCIGEQIGFEIITSVPEAQAAWIHETGYPF
ncbi:eCIS core domain-containing protein [Echinicola pacifica]|nr:DUF4157 domain-containing protein [Echinicola pacifica]